MEREDNILLQGTTFVSSILFFYVNIIGENSEIKILTSVIIISLAIPFFMLRGLAKIRQSGKLKYYSMWILMFLGPYLFLVFISTTLSNLGIPTDDPFHVFASSPAVFLFLASANFVIDSLRIRYGLE